MALTPADHQRGGIRSGQARLRLRAERADRSAILGTVLNHLEREQIAPELLEHAVNLIRRASDADVDIRSASDVRHLAEAGKIIHGMARLELGESTANVAHASIQDRMAQAAELQARLDALRAADQSERGHTGAEDSAPGPETAS